MRLTDPEWRLMHVLWDRSPRTAREVHDEVSPETDWAYTTVKTMLDRLVEKGALDAAREGRTTAYDPRITRDRARRSALQGLLDRAFDGTFGALVHHLAEGRRLSPRDRRALEELLEESKSPRKGDRA